MPNGRTGGFVIAKGKFGQLLSDVPKNAKIGKDLQSPVTAVEVAGLIEKHKKDEIFIEEQDGTWYILHFNPGSRSTIQVRCSQFCANATSSGFRGNSLTATSSAEAGAGWNCC